MDDYGSDASTGSWEDMTPSGLMPLPAFSHSPARQFRSRADPRRCANRVTNPENFLATALPGERLTAAVMQNHEQRRVLLRVLARFGAEGMISMSTLQAAELFVQAFPRGKQLPIVAPDGDGGVLMAWAVPGQGRTLVTVADSMLFVVSRAGAPDAEYLPDLTFDGVIAEEVLAIIPA